MIKYYLSVINIAKKRKKMDWF